MIFGLRTLIFVPVMLPQRSIQRKSVDAATDTKTKAQSPKFNLKLCEAQLQIPGIAFFSGRSSNNKTIAMNIAQPLRKIQNDE